MRVIDCIEAYRTLGRLPLSGIGDKAALDALLDDHAALWRVSRDFDEYMESLRGSDGAEEARRRYLWKEVDVTLATVGRDVIAGAAKEAGMTLADMRALGILTIRED